MKPSADTEEAALAIPATEKPLPILANALVLHEDPIVMKLTTLRQSPRRVVLLKDKFEPKCAESRTENAPETLVNFLTLKVLPRLALSITDRLYNDPTRKMPNRDTEEPHLP